MHESSRQRDIHYFGASAERGIHQGIVRVVLGRTRDTGGWEAAASAVQHAALLNPVGYSTWSAELE